MRAFTGGSIVLAFAIVLVTWDASRRVMHEGLKPQLPSFEVRDFWSDSAGATAPAVTPLDVAVAMPLDSAVANPTKAEAIRAGTRQSASQRAQQSTSPITKRRDTLALGVRQVTPGSKAHAEAIASAVQSDEYRNTVEPLARLYFAFFDRTADYEGLSWYIDERDGGVSLAAIADEFAGSTEFRLRYGTLGDAAFVDRLYRNIFDTVPDNAQRAYWVAQLESGVSRGQVMLAFSESPGFRAATANEVFVAMAYAQTLGTHPDPASLARWAAFLDAGNPREAVIAGLLARR